MKKLIFTALSMGAITTVAKAQDIKSKEVPAVVKSALTKKYPEANKVSWEKEKGNYEANWGGRSGEDNSVLFTPAGAFVEITKAIKVGDLPKNVPQYIKAHYHGAAVREAGKVTDASGKTMFDAEIRGADLLFDENGNFLRKD